MGDETALASIVEPLIDDLEVASEATMRSSTAETMTASTKSIPPNTKVSAGTPSAVRLR